MATMKFSIPNEVKERFNRAFAGENKSAIVTHLMQGAIEERKAQGNVTLERILARMHQRTPANEDEIRQACEEGRH